ncbi:Hypothetical Protein FCC1311_005172 [Hondaea fermentalgiana]|uniref:TLC domain-containing protein n=1 Tax=Hondaea fermentalgiana TaxID=2315210 RepID=A0A2R5G1W7_9STRA|nr:Hypothetical Protein FCC1311_005172 [Hondaea fermentalgiana]|eukprot:GBG24299.1 Hypothetical Protein FCC1311_005172 [Hondaea fermentalgiana]
MCKAQTLVQRRSAHVEPSPAGTSVSKPAPFKFPRIFLLWCMVKTSIQLSLSVLSITFIVQSGYFNPFGYDATVWSREDLCALCVPQAIFEIIDLFFETWMTMRVQKKSDHMPWDSIFHHTITAAYYMYVYYTADNLTWSFLGLPVAGLSCQVIGFLYTLHRLKYHFRWIGLALLSVQLMYRTPLAIVSCLRALQHFYQCPIIHFFICAALLTLDLRWTRWSFKLNARLQRQHRQRKEARKLATQQVPGLGATIDYAPLKSL